MERFEITKTMKIFILEKKKVLVDITDIIALYFPNETISDIYKGYNINSNLYISFFYVFLINTYKICDIDNNSCGTM